MTIHPVSTSTTTPARLHPAAHIGAATLAVSDLARALDFYTRVLGLRVLSQSGEAASLGAGGRALLHLTALPGATRQPERSTGLYHAAILLPSRVELGRVLLNLARTQYPVGGFSDHLVSEAIYLSDPDGNGLELYRDRPRAEWPRQDDGAGGTTIRMASDPIDLDGIVAEVPDSDAPFAGMPDGTMLGHMHLRVGDITQAEAFYVDTLGFDVVVRWHGALFVSAGGYHHHLGLNTWHSRNAPRPPADAVGLRQFEIVLPDEAARAPVLARLEAAGAAITHQGEAALVDDPWGNTLALVLESHGA